MEALVEFNDYQDIALSTAIYPDKGTRNLTYPTLGLVGEAGEVAEKVKKVIRDGKYDSLEIAKELSDVLWYISALAFELGYDLDAIATMNIMKLKDRQNRGVLKGSGDNR